MQGSGKEADELFFMAWRRKGGLRTFED